MINMKDFIHSKTNMVALLSKAATLTWLQQIAPGLCIVILLFFGTIMAIAETSSAITAPDGTVIVTITSSTTGRVWMDRNLGATQAAVSKADADSYGSSFQWCRGADGHQLRGGQAYHEGLASSPSTDAAHPWYGRFVYNNSIFPLDWLSTPLADGNLWWNPQVSVAGANNPCPKGYHVPTATEWKEELTGATMPYDDWLFEKLKLPLAGFRIYDSTLLGVGSEATYWSSSAYAGNAYGLYFCNKQARVNDHFRANNFSVRCIRDLSTPIPTDDL